MFKLRPYQQQATDWCFEHLLKEGNCLLVAPTGAGKSCCMADVAKRTLEYLSRELGRPAHGMCLIGQNEIHQQNLKTFNAYAPNIRTAVFDSNIKSCKGNMIFAMIGSIYKYRHKLPMFDFVIVDEAQHSQAPQEYDFIKTLKEKNPKLLVFGVTATPNRGDKVGLLPLFTNYYKIPIGLLFKCGYLVKPTFKVFDSAEPITPEGHEKFLESVHNNKVGKTVVFCKDVATALMYRDMWNAKYEKELAVCVHGEMSGADRADVIDKFKSGIAQIIFNVAVLTEGFDDPKIETGVLAKHYGTKGQYIQAVGRVLRSSPGKKIAYILDYGGNYAEHGDLQQDVDLEGEGKSVKGRKVVLDDLIEHIADTSKMVEKNVDFNVSTPTYFTPYAEEFDSINWFECDGMGIVGALNTDKFGIIIVGDDCYYTADKIHFEKVPIDKIRKVLKDFVVVVKDEHATAYQLRYLAGKYNIAGITKNRADSVILFDLWRNFAIDTVQDI